MTDWNWDTYRDTWYADQNSGTHLGNGVGPRLQSGRATGTDDYDNRFAASFQEPAGFDYGATVVSATWYGKVRGTNGCFSQGAAPKLLVRRFDNPDFVVTENSQAGECLLSGAGAANTEWPGPVSETADAVFWAGTPSAGTIISIDVTDLFVAWVAAKAGGTDKFGLTFDPSNAAGTATEFVTGRKIAFSSADADGDPLFSGGLGPYVKVVTDDSEPLVPDAATPLTPADGARVTQTGTFRTFTASIPRVAGWLPSAVQVRIAKSATVDGTGMLNTSVVYAGGTDIGTGMGDEAFEGQVFYTSIDDPTTEVRGNQYYWQVRYQLTEPSIPETSDWSPWSAVFDYTVNRVPIITKVRPA